MVRSQRSGDYSDIVSRRKFVSLAGATGVAAVAGCLDGGGGGGNDWFDATQVNFDPSNYHWNLLAGWEIPQDRFGMFAQWTQYLIKEDTFHSHLIKEWTHENGKMILTLSEEFTWGSGDNVTADDLVFQLDIFKAADKAIWQFIEGAEATGEYELTISYPEGTNKDIIEYALLGTQAAYSPENWEGMNWEEDPAGVEILDPDPSGPIGLTDHTDNYAQTEPRDGLDDHADHHLADHYNWEGYRVKHRDGNNKAHQSFINGDTDGQHSLFVDPDVLQQFPEEIHEFRIPGGFGMAIWFDHETEPWNQREVRQALYYSINRESVITSVGESTKISHHPAPTGLTWETVDEWFDSKEPDGFTVYERDVDKAEELLSEAGYDMGEITVELTYPQSWSDWATAAQTIVDHLNDAGWDASGDPRKEGPGGYLESTDVYVARHTDGGKPRMNHPYFSLDFILRNRTFNTEKHFANYPTTVELDGETIDIEAELQAFATANDEATEKEIVERLARVVNEDVPCIYVTEKYEQSFIHGGPFEIDAESPHCYSYWPLWWLPKVDESLDGYDTPGLMKKTD
ncbi:ABC transporter substrate-binding protein [Natrinema halophilum]|uniref:Solute-binding protein family 5 domain-containing protein n=1 Tax=Natrinema halophilum TaxID=1699371 RepID=A0A7D5H9D6_9EURY|nr:ABC transporter substrate-binding protein [Natrinema halophilum]QLG50195.1 ABC transporter substrate-binding protein [Natrinema halophilum]